jgi:DNA-binding Lrp family transcriptional regulator
MELKQVLAQVPGLNRRFIYYLEARGYIRPAQIQKRRIARRDFSHDDLAAIRDMWRYYKRGYALKAAYELATTTQRVVTYVGARVAERGMAVLAERLKDYPQILEVAAVHGADIDMLIKAETPNAEEAYHLLVPLMAETDITGLPQVLLGEESIRRDAKPKDRKGTKGMLAYILMKVPVKNVAEVMDQLKALEPVLEASTVYGESDIVAKVEVEDQEHLDTLIMEQVHAIPAVESTRTFVVIRRLHWSR